jgi:hypothetical protein
LNNLLSTKSNTILLATVLLTGTIVLLTPSFMADAQAKPYYGQDNNYNKQYIKNVNIKSIKCNNISVNVNGLELDVLPPVLANLLQGDEAERGTSSYESNGYGGQQSGYDNNKEDFKFVCINNNNNTIAGPDNPASLPSPPSPPETNANLIVIKHVINDNDGTATASDFLMSPQTFNIFQGGCTQGTNPTFYPSFPASESGTNVPLLVNDQGICYSVSEGHNPSEIGEYEASSEGCIDIIMPSETKTCTWTNNDIPNTSN